MAMFSTDGLSFANSGQSTFRCLWSKRSITVRITIASIAALPKAPESAPVGTRAATATR